MRFAHPEQWFEAVRVMREAISKSWFLILKSEMTFGQIKSQEVVCSGRRPDLETTTTDLLQTKSWNRKVIASNEILKSEIAFRPSDLDLYKDL